MRFESHVTLPSPNNLELKMQLISIARTHQMKPSWITGDPVLGDGKYFYISGFDSTFDVLLNKIKVLVADLQSHKFEVIREKIEQIMYDTKTGYFECGVNCTACLDT